MTLAATYYGANGWLLEFDDFRVLVDPWLRGSLSFPPGEWLLKGELPCERNVPEKLNLLLLTRGLQTTPIRTPWRFSPRTCPSLDRRRLHGWWNAWASPA